MKISVIIPSRGERELLWATYAAARADLEASGLDFEIVPVINGPKVSDIAGLLHQSGEVNCIFAGEGVDSPQAARNLGAQHASGEVLFFLDSHVIVAPGFFWQMLSDMRGYDADLLHSPHRFLGKAFYGFRVDWDGLLWSKETLYAPQNGALPFPIALAGHGACCVRRKAFETVDRYWKELKGFGGEETQLNLALWMCGFSCWMTPRTHHWHWLPGAERHGPEMFTSENFILNFLHLAYVFGGARQIDLAQKALRGKPGADGAQISALHEETMKSEALQRRCEWLGEHAKFSSLAALRAMFAARGVVH